MKGNFVQHKRSCMYVCMYVLFIYIQESRHSNNSGVLSPGLLLQTIIHTINNKNKHSINIYKYTNSVQMGDPDNAGGKDKNVRARKI